MNLYLNILSQNLYENHIFKNNIHTDLTIEYYLKNKIIIYYHKRFLRHFEMGCSNTNLYN